MSRPTVVDWLRLVRFPLALSAVGDALAGYWTAAGETRPVPMAALAGAAAALYCAGIALNDVADRDRDRTLHPYRPIPSGKLAAASAAIAGCLLLVAGVGASLGGGRDALLCATVTALCVVAYNFLAKRWVPAAGLTLAGARASNFAMGLAAAAPLASWQAPEIAALVPVALYAFCVTAASALEEEPARRWAYLPFAGGMLACAWMPLVMAGATRPHAFVFALALTVLLFGCASAAVRWPSRATFQHATAWSVRGATLLSATIVAVHGRTTEAWAVAAVLPLMLLFARLMRYDASSPVAAGPID